MRKSTFLLIAAIAAAVVIFFECSDTYSSKAIREAELQATSSETKQEKPAYIITLYPDEITVIDPNTGKTILAEKYDSKSTLAKAILKDNE